METVASKLAVARARPLGLQATLRMVREWHWSRTAQQYHCWAGTPLSAALPVGAMRSLGTVGPEDAGEDAGPDADADAAAATAAGLDVGTAGVRRRVQIRTVLSPLQLARKSPVDSFTEAASVPNGWWIDYCRLWRDLVNSSFSRFSGLINCRVLLVVSFTFGRPRHRPNPILVAGKAGHQLQRDTVHHRVGRKSLYCITNVLSDAGA
jgi:hypothetical protein